MSYNRSAVFVVENGKVLLLYRKKDNKEYYVVPGGTIEKDETLEQTTIRELKEETGYVADKVVKVSPILDMNPAMTDSTFQVVTIEVDETKKENITPKQELELTEDIEVFLLKKEEISEFLKEQQKLGVRVGPAVWYYFTDF